ncbi:polyprenyl synthetase family protein [candidate division KSB1 bacterium]|nr:polyprenyl synthetase family protein [candidate division KSB1 bacterium]
MSHTFEQKISELKKVVENRIYEIVNKNEPVTLYEPMRYAISSGGKRLRPVLLLLVNEAVGGTLENALDAAVALELVHNFTLVHDDIMDNDDLRRGRETVHKKWDANVAILSGDALLVLAYSALHSNPYPILPEVLKDFSRGILKVCEGQTLDKEFETRESVTLEEYYEMIDKKTAELFSVACYVGSILGGGSEEQINAMKLYGKKVGRAFQIQDDLLDVISEEAVLGKDIGSDIEENKKTFLVVHALENADEDQKQKLHFILNKKRITAKDVRDVIDIFRQTNTITATRNIIENCLNDAKKTLLPLPDNSAKHHLNELLDTIAKRNS